MGEIIKTTWESNVWLRILTITAILLLVVAFILPPSAIIDSSILAAVGELEGLGALWIVARAVDKGIGFSFKHNGTEIESHPDQEKEEEIPHEVD